jgi:hypothetical protein
MARRGERALAMRPEDVLLQWLLWLPAGADPAAAAIAELRRPELRHPADPRLVRLAALLQDVAAGVSRARQRPAAARS